MFSLKIGECAGPGQHLGNFPEERSIITGTDSFMEPEKLRSKSKKQLAAAKYEIQKPA
jgi:hypothetical protein